MKKVRVASFPCAGTRTWNWNVRLDRTDQTENMLVWNSTEAWSTYSNTLLNLL